MSILYAILGAIAGIIVTVLYKPFRIKLELTWENFCWKRTIPNNYGCIDKLKKVKKATKVEVLGEQYDIVGFIKYQFDGTYCYLPQIRPGYKLNTRWEIRWLGFEDENLYLWAEWDDNKFWEYIKTPRPNFSKYLSLPYLKDSIRSSPEPSIVINNMNMEIQCMQQGEILILYGEYGSFRDRCTRIKLKIADSDFVIGLIYYHDEPLNPNLFFGIEIECKDIKFLSKK